LMLAIALEPLTLLINTLYLAATWAAMTAILAIRIGGSTRRKPKVPPGDLEILRASIVSRESSPALEVVVVNRGPGEISRVSVADEWFLVIGEEIIGPPESVEAKSDVLHPNESVVLVWRLDGIRADPRERPREVIAIFGPENSVAVGVLKIPQKRVLR